MTNDARQWNERVMEDAPRSGAFLQSWEWGAFQEASGREVIRAGIAGRAVQGFRTALPLGGCYVFVPRAGADRAAAEWFAKSRDCWFVRYEPVRVPELESGISPETTRLRKTIDVTPPDTLLTDLARSEEDLLAAMHHKTRYNIRLAERKGVEISFGGGLADEVWKLFETTGTRGGFRLHPRKYYETMLETLPDMAFVASASYEGAVIAATLMLDFAGTRTYLHGASAQVHRNVMAPHLLHWELMKDAKAKGLGAYDWWGIAPEGAKDHPWAGVSRFKLGFGGERVSYPGTFDYVLKPGRYAVYGWLRRLRRMLP